MHHPGSMIVIYGMEHNYVICANKQCADTHSPKKDIIPTFYSPQHAHDEGWRFTKDRRFCSPGQEDAWVCPDCVAEFLTHEAKKKGGAHEVA